jgi:3-oxoacyl-(acyl-carrier-protein) synthase
MIQVGRAERMIVVAGDNASSDILMPWLGNGFRALGAATICGDPSLASAPFDRRRSGMILGSGGIGMVLESEEGAMRRFNHATLSGLNRDWVRPFRCRLLGTLFSNSAYHGAAMDKVHIASEMERFVSAVEKEQGITRKELAMHGVYFSHETGTHASPSSSCAANEVMSSLHIPLINAICAYTIHLSTVGNSLSILVAHMLSQFTSLAHLLFYLYYIIPFFTYGSL